MGHLTFLLRLLANFLELLCNRSSPSPSLAKLHFTSFCLDSADAYVCIQLSCCTAQRNWNTGSAQPPSCRLLTRSSWPAQQPHWLCLSLPICHLCIQGASAAHVQEESVALLQRRALFSSCIRIYMSASEMVPDLSLQLAAVVDRNMPSEMGSVGKNCCCVSVWLHLFRSSLAQVRVPIEENQFSFRDQWGYKLAPYYKATKFLLLQFYWCLSSSHRVSFVTFLKAWDGKLCKTKSKAMRQWKFSSMLSKPCPGTGDPALWHIATNVVSTALSGTEFLPTPSSMCVPLPSILLNGIGCAQGAALLPLG